MARISRRSSAPSSGSASLSATAAASSASSSAAPNIKSSRADYLPKYIIDGAAGFRAAQGGGSAVRLPASVHPDALRGLQTGDAFAVHPSYDYDSDAFGTPPSSVAPLFTTARLSAAAPAPDSSPTSPPFLQNKTSQAQMLAAERERIRAEFFATYDVMTGVRIAATLSGFFGLMVFLIVWKSRSSSNETLKVLKDPKMAAVAAVCMQEEEERKIQEAMVATGMSIYPDEYDAILYRRQRMLSLGNVSAPPVLHRGYRFSSVGGGGYSSLLEPPRRFSYSYSGQSASSLLMNGTNGDGGGGERRRSGSESLRILSNYPMGNSFGTDDYFIETDDELENDDDYHDNGRRLLDDFAAGAHHRRTDSTKSSSPAFLVVPHVGYDSRRSSAMTCCSTESSYLERRCSAFTLGVGNLPPSLQRKLSTASRASSPDNWDYYYPDIQVVQPTPKASPCTSEPSGTQSGAQSTAAPAAAANQIAATTSSAATSSKPTTTKTASRPSTAGNGAGVEAAGRQPAFVRKHSIAYYDPESAQAGRQQQIHSISADTADLFPYNYAPGAASRADLLQATAAGGGFLCSEPSTDELHLSVRRKMAAVDGQQAEQQPLFAAESKHKNYDFLYSNSKSATAAPATTPAATANSSSLSMDSSALSVDKLNGSGSLGTTARTFFQQAEKRAPLASLSSFKISSLEYQDSDLRSLDEDSVFVESAADTDDDIQQFSSESEEVSAAGDDAALATVEASAPAAASTQSSLEQSAPFPMAADCYSAEAAFTVAAASVSSRLRRPFLQRHRTISASSSDRISLLDQQLKDFPVAQAAAADPGSGAQLHLVQATQALETHFGSVVTTSSPPTHLRRAQLLQQHSDPQSLPTNTTNTEDDTCSTLNTEVCAAAAEGAPAQAHDGGSFQVFRKQQQLPRSRLADDPCAAPSSPNSGAGATPEPTARPLICVPSSFRNLIIRGATSPTGGCSRPESEPRSCDGGAPAASTACPAVLLELPLIKLPTDDNSDCSSASDEAGGSRSLSDESHDPSLPRSSRKWSKETLF